MFWESGWNGRADGEKVTVGRFIFSGKQGGVFAVVLLSLVLLYITAVENYAFFHSIEAIFIIVIAGSIFVVAWNSRFFLDNHYFLVLGISCLFLSIMEFLHMLLFAGIPLFRTHDEVMQAQLTAAIDYVQSLALLTAPFFSRKRMKPFPVFAGFAAMASIILLAIFFYSGPVNDLVRRFGLESFTRVNGLFIVCLFLASLLLLIYRGAHFKDHVRRLLGAFTMLLIAAEILFILFPGQEGFGNMTGHIARVAAYYLLYRAVIVAGLVKPYDLFFHSLAHQKETLMEINKDLEQALSERTTELMEMGEKLRSETEEKDRIEKTGNAWEARYRQLHDGIMEGVVRTDMSGRIKEFNKVFMDMTGYDETALKHLTFWDITPDRWHRAEEKIMERQIVPRGYSDIFEKEYRRKDGTVFPVELQVTLFRDDRGDPVSMLAIVRDITERKRTEEALRQSEEQYRTLFDGANDAILITSLDGRILKANRIISERYGYSRDELLGINIGDVLLSPDRSCIPDWVDRLRRFGTAVFEVLIADKEKNPVPIEVNARLIDYNEEVAVLSVARDITERKKAENALYESEARFRSLFTDMMEGVCIHQWVYDDNGQVVNYEIIDVNPRYEKILGLSRENVIGKTATEAYGTAEPPYMKEYWDVVVNGHPYHFDTYFAPMDRYFAISVINHGKDRFATIFHDITERKRYEEELLRYRLHLEDLVARKTADLEDLYNNAPCGYHSLDSEGRFIRVNDTELKMFGYERDELIGKAFAEVITEESRKDFARLFPLFKKQGWLKDTEFDLIRKDGSILPILVNATALCDLTGRYVRSRSTVLNNSERQASERAIKKLNDELEERAKRLEMINDELESFSYSVSHDLKGPLRVIEGYAKLLLENHRDKLNDEARSFLMAIRKGAVYLTELIDDLFDYARLGHLKSVAGFLDVPLFVSEVLKRYSDEISLHGATVETDLENVTLHVAAGDLDLVLGHLIENALKFSSTASNPLIKITGRQKDNLYILSIGDNGIGFNMDYKERIFEVFYRISRSEEYPGTGIGLAMVRRMMRKLGGRVRAEGEPGKGAVFHLEFPL